MNVVDSSGWLEYFAGGRNAGFFARPIEDTPRLLVPTLSLLEVFKRVLQQRGEPAGLQAVAHGSCLPRDALDTGLGFRGS